MNGLQTIEAKLHVSRTLILANVIGHSLAGTALLVVAIEYRIALIAVVPLIYHAYSMHRRITFRHRAAWQSLRWTLDNRVYARRVDDRQETGQCVVARCWGAAWLQLTVRLSGRWLPRFIVLPADALDDSSHRRLRVRSRIRAPQNRAADADTV